MILGELNRIQNKLNLFNYYYKRFNPLECEKNLDKVAKMLLHIESIFANSENLPP